MKEDLFFNHCVKVLTGEIEILKKFSATQKRVRQAVMNREWADFDEKTEEIRRLGEEFALLEKDRILLFDSLENGSSASEEKPFYSLIRGLPFEESRELSRLYRELKMETLKMRALNETFLAYLNEAKTMAAAYLEAVCPARGGKLYTRRGSRVSQDLRSMVFNNSF